MALYQVNSAEPGCLVSLGLRSDSVGQARGDSVCLRKETITIARWLYTVGWTMIGYGIGNCVKSKEFGFQNGKKLSR